MVRKVQSWFGVYVERIPNLPLPPKKYSEILLAHTLTLPPSAARVYTQFSSAKKSMFLKVKKATPGIAPTI